jgi:alpha-L-rhamnosidase
MMRLSVLLVALLLVGVWPAAAEEERPAHHHAIAEPHPWLSGANASGAPPVAASPDPFVGTTWGAGTNATTVQLYNATKFERWESMPAGSFAVSRVGTAGGLTVAVHAPGSVMIDFGVEHAGWVEFASADPAAADAAAAGRLWASISEYTEPYDGKTKPVVSYAGGVFRLEPNAELYEGVRFVWIFVEVDKAAAAFEPFTLTNFRLVSQVKPVNYAGHFASSDDVLTSAWYTGAYGSRLNMEDDDFNSILMERGDRVSIQGDGHPTMAAALVAFGGAETYRLVKVMLNSTDSGFVHGHKVVDQTIMPYPIYWGMSVNDWYRLP